MIYLIISRSFKESLPLGKCYSKAVIRDFSENNITKFRTYPTNINWSNLLSDDDPNKMYNTFSTEFLSIYDLPTKVYMIFPTKTIKIKNSNRPLTPWITKALVDAVREKNKFYRKFNTSQNSVRESHYKKYKNKLIYLIKIAKKTYYEDKFEAVKNNHKATWRLINELINKRKAPQTLPSLFKTDSCSLSDPIDIANTFCKYFTNIGPGLASKIPDTNVSFRSFLNSNCNESIFLRPTNVNELQEICSLLKPGKAPGYNNISMYIIKRSFDLLAEPLANIINISLSKGIFPDKLKIAKIIPIFKTGEHNSFTNNRPISLLTLFFEKVMQNRLTSFIDHHGILYKFQFGFRSNHSTPHSLISLINNIAFGHRSEPYSC